MQHPSRIGKYEIEEFLGGGMSHVYRARDSVIGRTVAVKVLTPEGCADSEAKNRFLLEARMAGNIDHENIIKIHEFGEDHGQPYLVMEFLRGEDLRSVIKNNRGGNLNQKLQTALQVARALEYIHAQRIIHRDIKPENVHVTAKGVVKLMDFGIAKTEGFNMTRAGFVLGTPYYMAPEQVQGSELTPLVDVYAFGILLFELLIGQKPFQAESVERIFYAILNEPLNLEPLKQAGIPQQLCDLVARCTEKKAVGRPQSFTEICQTLEQIQHELFRPLPTVTVAMPGVAAPSKRIPKWLPIGLAALVLAGAGLWFATQRPKRLEPVITTPTGVMLLVPAGDFLAGEHKERATLPAFYVDKTEVSNEAYAKYCKATGRPVPASIETHPDLPATDITYVDAAEFAKWAGKRLPKPLEWEKAARGTDGRLFPWGNEADAARANLASQASVPVSNLPQGASPYGALNMAGNALEFVDQLRTPSEGAIQHFTPLLPTPASATEPWYTMKGGSYHDPVQAAVTYEWASVPARYHAAWIGFRCVKDP